LIDPGLPDLPAALAAAARPVVNTLGPWTRVGNSRPDDDVLAAMTWAARRFLVIDELHRAASAIIARVTGAEAGCATNGAAGALLGAVAACRAGLNAERMKAVPDVPQNRDVVLYAIHRSAYEPCLRAAGARLVVVDDGSTADPLVELAGALGPDTAAVFYDAQPAVAGTAPPSADGVRVAHANRVAVIVDASPALPPYGNLTALVATGAEPRRLLRLQGDRRPRSVGVPDRPSGPGRLRPAQQADGDIRDRLGLPRAAWPVQMAIGRVTKTGKDEIVGLLVALDRYAQAEPPAPPCDLTTVLQALEAVPGVNAEIRLTAAARSSRPPSTGSRLGGCTTCSWPTTRRSPCC
jgi:D-glucosaminate-6-phosphate ammonia-lyase